MKQTCPTPRRQESMKASNGLPSIRSPQAGIVPLTDMRGGGRLVPAGS